MNACIHCGHAAIREWPEFGRFQRITSDCRPWTAGGRLGICTRCATVQTPVTTAWLEECQRIYADYHAYHQGNGAEQAVFCSGGLGQARSATFLSWIFANIPPADSGRLLDFGCGSGNLLASMSERCPGWRLAGADLGELHRGEIEAIPNVEWFHSRGLEQLPGSFDLITAVHLVEHLDHPVLSLKDLTAALLPGGSLAIEVPNLRTNPFDLLIADHASHFTSASLRRTLVASGLSGEIHEDVIPRELSVIARRAEPAGPPPGSSAGDLPLMDALGTIQAEVDRHLAWLGALAALAHRLAAKGPKLALMGSSIAAGWLAGEVAGRIDCFVDEDPNRAGGAFLGRPILAPEQLPRDVTLLLPMTLPTAEAVAARMTAMGLSTILPPPW